MTIVKKKKTPEERVVQKQTSGVLSKQKISKCIGDLNNDINQQFFSEHSTKKRIQIILIPNRTSNIDHILDTKLVSKYLKDSRDKRELPQVLLFLKPMFIFLPGYKLLIPATNRSLSRKKTRRSYQVIHTVIRRQ